MPEIFFQKRLKSQKKRSNQKNKKKKLKRRKLKCLKKEKRNPRRKKESVRNIKLKETSSNVCDQVASGVARATSWLITVTVIPVVTVA